MDDWMLVALAAGALSTAAWVGCGLVAARVAHRRGASLRSWIAIGMLLGPVGLFLIYRVLNHTCPHCGAPVLRAVRICPHCNESIPRLKHNPVGPFWTYRRDW